MSYKRLPVLVILASLTFLLAGCGGPQNPLQVDIAVSGELGRLVSGLWDGFWALLGLVLELFNNKYGIYDVRRNSLLYDIGWVIGFLAFVSLVFGGGWRYRRRRRV